MLGELNVSILDCSWLCLGAGIVNIIMGVWWFVLLLVVPLPFLFYNSHMVRLCVGCCCDGCPWLVGGVVLGIVMGRVMGMDVGWETEYGRSAGRCHSERGVRYLLA